MTATGGVSVVIPTGGAGRLQLLDATLAWLRRCAGVDQIILSELGEAPHALDLARRWQADHVFTAMHGVFDRAAARNAGIALAQGEELLWCDGDLIFRPDFVRRAQQELRARKLDYLAPFSRVEYLDEAQSARVIAGQCDPATCRPIRVLESLRGAPGGMWLVRRDFLRRHGGIPIGFKGWGQEDDAWLHKASLLGRIGATEQQDQRAWHLFHPDSGSHSHNAAVSAMRANPHFARNAALLQSIHAIQGADEWQRRFPPAAHEPPPWAPATRIAFLAVAGAAAKPSPAQPWATQLQAAYGITVPVPHATPATVGTAMAGLDADVVVGFVDDAAGHAAFAATAPRTASVLVVDDGVPVAPWPDGAPPTILARRATQVAAWRQAGYPVWHRPWDEAPGDGAAPVLVQPLSHLLAAPRAWQVRIVIDRAALAPSAFDAAPFWYVGLHDEEDTELLREDMRGPELHHAVAAADGPIVISRALRSTRRPTRWTVWPTDRRGYWLDKLSGDIAPDALSHGDGA